MDPSRTALYLGRFAPPAVSLPAPPGKGSYTLSIPDDGVGVPWRLLVSAGAPVSVCPA